MRLGRPAWGDTARTAQRHDRPGTFAMQSLWSNAVTAACLDGRLQVTVTTPTTQTATTGKAVSLKIRPRSPARTPR